MTTTIIYNLKIIPIVTFLLLILSISLLSRNNASILVVVIKINDTRHAFIKPTLKLFDRNIDGINKLLSDKLKK